MNSHSQYGEDKVVADLFAKTKRCGRLLDIGAWQPITFSNSRLLIENGWDAVLVEFSPDAVRALLKEYGNNKHVKVLQAAVTTTDNGHLTEYTVTDDAVSTSVAAIEQKWAGTVGYYGKLWVPNLTLDWINFQFGGGFEFVSIDTEGTSVDLAVQYLGPLGQRPEVMIVEHDDRMVELMRVAQQCGYVAVHYNGTNVVLAR